MILSVVLALASVNVVTDCGADPTGATDSRASIQSCIADGADLYFPPGTYTIGRSAPTQTWGLTLAGRTRIIMRGHNAVLRAIGGDMLAKDFEMVRIRDASRVTLRDIALDGNRANMTNTDEQTHALYVYDASDVVVDGVECYEWAGDCAKIMGNGGTKRLRFRDCDFHDTGRSGITLQSYSDDVTIDGCRFHDISDQAIDFEPTGATSPSRIKIINNSLVAPSASQIVLTLSGSGTLLTRDVVVSGNTIVGTIHAVRLQRALISGNEITASGRCFDLSRTVEDVTISNNHMDCGTGLYTASVSGSHPTRITVSGNTILADYGWQHEGGGPGALTVRGNSFRRATYSSAAFAVKMRNTTTEPLTRVIVDGNSIEGYGYGVDFAPTHGPISDVQVTRNLQVDGAKVTHRSSTTFAFCRGDSASNVVGNGVSAGDSVAACE